MNENRSRGESRSFDGDLVREFVSCLDVVSEVTRRSGRHRGFRSLDPMIRNSRPSDRLAVEIDHLAFEHRRAFGASDNLGLGLKGRDLCKPSCSSTAASRSVVLVIAIMLIVLAEFVVDEFAEELAVLPDRKCRGLSPKPMRDCERPFAILVDHDRLKIASTGKCRPFALIYHRRRGESLDFEAHQSANGREGIGSGSPHRTVRGSAPGLS